MAESKRGLKCVLYCKCMYTVPENSGMSVDVCREPRALYGWDGVVDMTFAVKLKKISQSAFYLCMYIGLKDVCMIVNTLTHVCTNM